MKNTPARQPEEMAALDPTKLEPISRLCREGFIPYAAYTVREMCRNGTFPALRCRGQWMTTRDQVLRHLTLRTNSLFRQYLEANNKPKNP